ncbi:MAG TPA: oligosaccharide flippase family protein [Bacteroidota bacterium]|nr:oligosaccharide flippase family protein [Bacteroidota bacterium]
MFSQIKRLGADTAVYGISTIVGRFLTFLLVPFYTNVLLPGQYGIVAIVFSYIAFLNVIYSYGMESSYFRYASSLEVGDEKDNFSTPFFSLAATGVLFSGLLYGFAASAAPLFQIDASYYRVIRYAAGILLFDTLMIVPFASLRLARKAKFFAALKIINIVSNVAFNIISLMYLHWGVEGIFFSGLASSMLTFAMLTPHILRKTRLSFSIPLYKELLRFGLPYIPVGISGIILQVVDRPILKLLSTDSAVGIYQANYRLGIFMNLVSSMFEYAWRPFFLSHAKDENAKPLFARVMTYYVLASTFMFLVLSLFITDLVTIRLFHNRYLIHPGYWSGLGIVPIVLLAYVFGGISINLNAGIQIQKKTMYLLPTSIIAAVSNIIANFLLIPSYGIYGAAYATLIAYVLSAAALYVVAQKFYRIEYEFMRLLKIAVVTAGVYGFHLFIHPDALLWQKVMLVFVWMLFIRSSGFFTDDERRAVKKLLRFSR